MGRLFGGRHERGYWGISQPSDLVPRRVGTGPGNFYPSVTADRAMQNSAVWAALRLRADLISTLPLKVYRDVVLDPGSPASQVESNIYGVLNDSEFCHWAYASQVELDRTGNSVGVIREVDGAGYPALIDLQASSDCHATIRGTKIVEWRIGNDTYSGSKLDLIWHEKQYVVAGFPMGLSPVAYAAWTLSEYRSVEQFVTAWFMSGQTPRARLKNVEREIPAVEAAAVKEAFMASQAMGEPFVHGSDWEYEMVQAQQASADWLEAMRIGAVDIARFFNVPANVIDANVSGQSVTYANLTTKDLDLLIHHLGPTIVRRERAWSKLIPRPRYVKLDTDELLRMDPQTRAQWVKTQIDSRVLAPSEARAMAGRKPFTDDQIDEFERLGLNKTASGALAGEVKDMPVPAGTQSEPLSPDQAQQGNNPNG